MTSACPQLKTTMLAIALQKKQGVVHLATPSGGVLLDIERDRFLNLSPLSSAIWSSFANDETEAAVKHISTALNLGPEEATSVFYRQVDAWTRGGLLTACDAVPPLPFVLIGDDPALKGYPSEEWQGGRFSLRLIGEYLTAEWRYRRLLRRRGLCWTLIRLQSERRSQKLGNTAILRTIIRNYYGARRTYHQGAMARDCLQRSLALAAMLKRRSIDVQLCIGIIDLPFSSHAWVEAGGYILNETAEKRSRYAVIARF